MCKVISRASGQVHPKSDLQSVLEGALVALPIIKKGEVAQRLWVWTFDRVLVIHWTSW